ncbi:mitochondrial carrier domain-containing protein [Cokeromyces recurvatus]|uniref:mitochondrial carrier domain-containing protein n=1 Tax=Cokeromyces recurvatus TaxID=90255 RepID=UPI00221EBBB3|nr:mitochondrial carrier domain-containing protein [Cokeromyces recurvatus]KAI7902880.1 mitochondrial carrier domain-containing protein [Cokeromyces recurvatus]
MSFDSSLDNREDIMKEFGMGVCMTIVAASSAAIAGVVSGYPFDSIKTRLQTQSYNSITTCIKITYKEEGIRGFFRGVLPPLITVSIIKSISFSVYENTKGHYKTLHPAQFMNSPSLISTMFASTLAGSVSGAFIAALSCPFELVKVQKQLEFLLLKASSVSTGTTVMMHDSMENNKPPTKNKSKKFNTGTSLQLSINNIVEDNKQFSSTSSWYSAKEIIKKKGIFGIYSGFTLHLNTYIATLYATVTDKFCVVRDTIGTGVYFGGYETIKYILTTNASTAGPLTQFLAGGLCGLMCWIVIFPLDLIKTLKQKEILSSKPKYTLQLIQDIYKQHELTGFYKGLTVTLIRAFPIHSLNFLVYEQTLILVHYLTQK